MTDFGYDDVTGVVVGDISKKGQLFYDNRPQSQEFWGTDKELISRATNLKQELMNEYNGFPNYLYQEDKWELRIY
jgi:hypothetical protein